MVYELNYPFDSGYILKKKKSIKKRLLEDQQNNRMHKKIAILGGSTTKDIKDVLELFLLNIGIEPCFYESEYNQYWEEAVFGSENLHAFNPDIIYIHTSSRNLYNYPSLDDSTDQVRELTKETFQRFVFMWDKLIDMYHCTIIQNNFEMPYFRFMGNKDVSDIHGRLNFINQLNECFYGYARDHENFYINDINYLAACYGLQKWADPFSWYLYKYALSFEAIPELSYNIANIIKSIYGKNKKAMILDLDNTLWGGIIGEDGAEQIEIGQESAVGQAYCEFQQYIKAHKSLGILLGVNSKNDFENALSGLQRPDSVLKPEDFIAIKANWEPKDRNLCEIAKELNVDVTSLVFVDDNPAERHIVINNIPGVSVPEVGQVETYINILDRCGFFEVTNFSEEDLKRFEMYKGNHEREMQQKAYPNYKDYLLSLEMRAEINSFTDLYIPRIAQLTNKSNQFNLTTKRYSVAEIQKIASDPDYISLYGKLTDKFGDNGVVSVIVGHQCEQIVHIDLWLMSCRVLKRDMEFAMMDELISICKKRKIEKVLGYYYPTSKNNMVKEFYGELGFRKISEKANRETLWELNLAEPYINKNTSIRIVNKMEL